jgi:NAD(P)-dependent dehydrogenase (short-subunit alcohol dehydrogenase family)
MTITSPTDLNGRVAVITGATRNIGLATAREFARAGADLVISARSADTLHQVAAELEELGPGRVVPVTGDVTVADDLDRLASSALDSFGGVDVLVNNALVVMEHDSILDASDTEWEKGLRGYIQGPLRLIRTLAPSMAERGQGSIVNLVSTAGFMPVAGLGAYGVMKSAMWTLTRYLAAELAPQIRVNAVCPGTTSPDGTTEGRETWERLIKIVPLRRMGGPEESAKPVLFLASSASSYTTGQVIFVDGGRVGLGGANDLP